VGDADRQKFVLFFDDAPDALLNKIEQVVRLIRSEEVGVYFITQSTQDVPEDILDQPGMKIQYALRAVTPKDKKVVKTAAASFRPNPKVDAVQLITEPGAVVRW